MKKSYLGFLPNFLNPCLNAHQKEYTINPIKNISTPKNIQAKIPSIKIISIIKDLNDTYGR